MPNIQSAKKKLRQDKKRYELNLFYKNRYKKAVRAFMADPKKENLDKAVSLIDKAAKKNVIHENTAGRLKSKLSKLQASKHG